MTDRAANLTDNDRRILVRVIASSAIVTAQIEQLTGEFDVVQRERAWGIVVTGWCRLHETDAEVQTWYDKVDAYQKELGADRLEEVWLDAQAAT